MNNFILLDGLTLYVFIGLLILLFFCGVGIAGNSLVQDRQIKKLREENKKLDSEVKTREHQLTVANTTLEFIKNRNRELEEEINLRDEVISESLRGNKTEEPLHRPIGWSTSV